MPSSKTINEYIKRSPKEAQEVLKKIRQTIKKIIPKAEEGISYGMPVFKVNGKYVVYFAGYKKHVSVYPIISKTPFEKQISPYRSGRGTARFYLDKPIPYGLIKKIVKFQLKQNLQRGKKA